MNPHDNNYMRPAEETDECMFCGTEIEKNEGFCSKDCARAYEND